MNCPHCGALLVEDDPNKYVGEVLDDDKISILMFCETCEEHYFADYKFTGLSKADI